MSLSNNFEWIRESNEALFALAKAVKTPTVFAIPNLERPTIVFSDASNFAVGTVLLRKFENGREHQTEFPSRKC